jgi:hypothetical protein
MKFTKVGLAIVLLGLTNLFCGMGGLNVQTWLNSMMTEAPKVDLSGKWNSGSVFTGGWGEGNFFQEEGRFSGTLGLYSIKGVVSGIKVFLYLFIGGKVYYTGQLALREDGTFFGKIESYNREGDIYTMTLEKMK